MSVPVLKGVPTAMRKLKINLDDLELAFESSDSYEIEWYLDLETGDVVLINDDIRSQFEAFMGGEAVEDKPDKGGREEGVAEQAESEEEMLARWVRTCEYNEAEALAIYRIEQGETSRYEPIEHDRSSDAYRDMEEFTETVQDEHLKELLWVALDGKGAFRRFKDVLLNHSEERERWFAFRDERVRERLLEWLHAIDVEMEE